MFKNYEQESKLKSYAPHVIIYQKRFAIQKTQKNNQTQKFPQQKHELLQ
jgi:hypothetical protein